MPTGNSILYEVIDRRTETAKHWRMDDGSYLAKIYMAPVHYEDENGMWQNIDTTIVDPVAVALPKQPVSKTLHSNGGWAHSNHFTVPYNKADIRLPKNIKAGYAIGFGDDRITFTPQNASPSLGQINPTVSSEIDYQDVWVDTDLTLTVQPNGVKETIVLKSNNSPSDFTFRVDGPLASDFTSGSLKILSPWYEDANGTRKDATMTQRTTGGQTFIDITLDPTGLVYPIMLDPTTTTQDNTSGNMGDTYVASQQPTINYGTANQMELGSYWNTSGTWVDRALVGFDVSSLPSGSAITSASMGLYLYGYSPGSSVSSTTVEVHTNSASWTESSVTWNNKPAFDSAVVASVTYTTPVANGTHSLSTFDVTSAVQSWFSGAKSNYGFTLKTASESASGSTSVNTLQYDCKESMNWIPYLSVNYDQPPGAPTVTAPNGGETINTTFNITWTAATDPDTAQSSLVYQIDLSEDNGSTWTTIVSQTAAGATSYTYDFTNKAQSSTCLVRIRAYDGTAYGPYDQSNGVFTIQHNQAPTQPTNLVPSGGSPVDRASVIRLSWQHNDPNGDPQSKFDLQYSTDDGTTWTTVSQTTINQYYDVPANTFPHGNVLWQVRTYDQADLSGPYSSQATFLAGDKPAKPTITSPTDGATIPVSRPTVEWSSFGQSDYQVQVLDATHAVYWDSTDVASTNKAVTVGTDMQNNTAYTIQARIKNSDGIWSDWNAVGVTVSFTPPATPTVDTVEKPGYILVSITNPAPTGTEPDVASNDLHRMEPDGTWLRIATGLPANGTYKEFGAAGGATYQYKAIAQGSNGTTSDPYVVAVTTSLRGAWICAASDPDGTIHQFKYDGEGRSIAYTIDSKMMQFEGRSLPVADIADQETRSVKITVKCRNGTDDLQALRDLIASRQTVLYRDGRGRKIYGVISALPEQDDRFGTNVDLTIDAVDYSEVV